MRRSKLKNNDKNQNTKNGIKDIITGIITLFILVVIVYYVFRLLGIGILKVIKGIVTQVSKLDAVVIVALITGMVSILSVIISSVISKIIDFRKNRNEYLAQKREEPYGEFVDMIYKIQQNSINENSYTEEMMIEDLSRFSKKITLWGSHKVVKKWVEFRKNGSNPEAKISNLFVLEQIMNEMRKDLGLRKMKKGELLAFFVNDIDDVVDK